VDACKPLLSGGVSSVASAQLEANSLEKEELLALKKRQLEVLKAGAHTRPLLGST